MYLERKAYEKLQNWKKTRCGKTALLIEGARRVGKTTLARTFAAREYETFIHLDFSQINLAIPLLFEQSSFDLDAFFSQLSLLTRTKLIPRRSCIIFDEVQLFPLARQMIKHLVADGRFDYIETGSLISIRHNTRNILIPSEEEKLELSPLDFEEFLNALGNRDLFAHVRTCFNRRKPLGESLHRELMRLIRLYMVIGGMPQAVETYAADKDLLAVRDLQKTILSLYRDDIAKYAAGYELKIQSIFDAIPGELSKHEKRFKLAALEKNARMRRYEEAFLWLSDSKVVNLSFNATEPSVGLTMNTDRTLLKCYMADTGLLVSMATEDGTDFEQEVLEALLFKKLDINEGMFFENLVAQMLRSAGHKLFFYTQRLNTKEKIEIDFLIRNKKKISPIEVKSADNKSHWSLDMFSEKYRGKLGEKILVGIKDLQEKDGILFVPVYMTELL